MGAESCEKSESFSATNFWSETLVNDTFCARSLWGNESFVHGSGGMRRRVWFKIQKLRSPPREAKKSNTQSLSRTLNLARCTQRKAPSSSHQPACMALNLEVSSKAPALPIELTQDLMDAFEIISNKRVWRFGARSGFDEGHAVSASSMGLSRHNRGREEGERRSL